MEMITIQTILEAQKGTRSNKIINYENELNDENNTFVGGTTSSEEKRRRDAIFDLAMSPEFTEAEEADGRRSKARKWHIKDINEGFK